MRGGFVFVGGDDEIAVFFFDFSEQIVQLGGVFLLQQRLDESARIFRAADADVGEREVVAVVVVRGVDVLRLFEIRRGVGDFALANVGFAEIVIRVEIVGLELNGFAEMLLGFGAFAKARKIGGEIGVRLGGFRIQASGFLQICVRLCILRLPRIVEAEEFVQLKALWRRRE